MTKEIDVLDPIKSGKEALLNRYSVGIQPGVRIRKVELAKTYSLYPCHSFSQRLQFLWPPASMSAMNKKLSQ